MHIVLKQDVNTETVRFLGEVAYRDERKFEVYKNIFKDASTENEMKELLLSEGINEHAINEFCKTLRRLKIIDNEGAISKDPLIGEYGEYFLTIIYNKEYDLAYNFLPIRMERSIQKEHTTNTSFSISPKEFLNSVNETKDLVAEKPVCSIFKVDSPTLIRENPHEENIAIDIDENKDEWNLQVSDNSFGIPREKQLTYHQLFKEELIEENSNYYLRLPLEKAKDKSKYKNVILDFNASFRERIHTDDWGDFDAEYKNVDVLPKESEVSLWYNEIFNTTLKVEGYLSQEDLEFKWDEILRDKEYLQRDEYKKKIKPFDYENLIERYHPKQVEYWLLQAATDLNPYSQPLTKAKRVVESSSISIPKTDNGQIKADILDQWEDLYSAKKITIIDPYANNYHSLRAIGELFSQMESSPEEVVIVSQRDEKYYEERQKKYIDRFKEKYNVKLDLHDKKEIPHDRYWFIDEKAFTVGVSPNVIWIRNDHIEIKQQININRIESENLPAEIVKWSH